VIVYGDPREEQPGAVVQRFPEDRMVFLALLDLEGDGQFAEVPGSPVWIAGLDFVAETNSGSFHRDEVWIPVRDAALAAYRPGEFVTFQAAEVGDNRLGHRCVYFRGSEPEPGAAGTLADTAPGAMHARYRGRRDVLLTPHHTKMWFSWDSWDPALEPVMEIHSVWGSSERPGQDRWPMREIQGGKRPGRARSRSRCTARSISGA
jgi:hypothetical protein